MRRSWFTTTGLAIAIASLVLAGCSSTDTGKENEQERVEKVEKVEKVERDKEKVEKRTETEKEKEGKAKP